MLLNYERKLMESLERPAVVSDTIPGHCSCLQTDQSEKGMRRWGTIADQDSGHCLVSRDCNGILIGQRKTDLTRTGAILSIIGNTRSNLNH